MLTPESIGILFGQNRLVKNENLRNCWLKSSWR